MYYIGYIIIGIIAGFVASKIMRDTELGLLLNLIVGIVGALLGGWLFTLIQDNTIGLWGNFLTSLVGAILLLWVTSRIVTAR